MTPSKSEHPLHETSTKPVAEKLREARALIERGWHQGSYLDGTILSAAIRGDTNYTACCLLGAIGLATNKLPDADDTAVELMIQVIGVEPVSDDRGRGTVETDIANWNDAPERTQTEVLAAFDKAIELAEKAQ